MADPSVENAWVEAPQTVSTNCYFCMAIIVVPLSLFESQLDACCFDAGRTGCYRRFKENK